MNNSTIQKYAFPDGGFVLHKITGNFKGRCSAWFDAAGKLESAEQLYWNGTRSAERDVKKDGPIWDYLTTFGPRYASETNV